MRIFRIEDATGTWYFAAVTRWSGYWGYVAMSRLPGSQAEVDRVAGRRGPLAREADVRRLGGHLTNEPADHEADELEAEASLSRPAGHGQCWGNGRPTRAKQ